MTADLGGAPGRIFFVILGLSVFIFLGACASETPDAQVAQLPTVAPTIPLPSGTPTPTPTIPPPTLTPTATATDVPTPTPTETPVVVLATPFPTPFVPDLLTNGLEMTYGHSWQGHELRAYQIGTGPTQVIVIGGIHGGYEWNTILLAYELLDRFDEQPDLLPEHITLTIIPSANPDGQFKTTSTTGRFDAGAVAQDTVPGRTNGNQVDLNRNWDCNWETIGLWRNEPVSGGAAPFSEVESFFLRDFILERDPAVVVFLHSAFPGVFPGRCNVDHAPSIQLGQIYASAAGYPFFEGGFTAYPVTGDATDYLALQDIPSFSVELNNHSQLDFRQNLAGLQALLEEFPAPEN